MPATIDVEQEFNLALDDACRGKVKLFFNIGDQYKMEAVTLDEVFRERVGCACVYWGDSSEKELAGCCTGPRTQTVIIDCYGSDRETAGRISSFIESQICALEPRTYRRWSIRKAKLYPEQAQTYGERLILSVQYTS